MLGVSGRVMLLLVTGGMDVKTKSCSIPRLLTWRNFLERRECCTHTLDSECWLSDSGSRWLEAEVNSASSVTVTQGESIPRRNAGGSDGYDTSGQDKDEKDHDEWTNKAKSLVARYRGIAWTAGKKYGNAILRSCNELEKWRGEHREELQQWTLPEIWKESSDEVEKK